MKSMVERATRLFESPMDLRGRLLVLAGALALLPTFVLPLWRMTLYSNQFPEGLVLNIYSHKLEGERSPYRDDLKEINALNHYIGMRPLVEEDFTEFDWIPFVVGGVILLGLRVVIFGKMSKLIDLFVLFCYFGMFSLWSFYRKLYLYGHELDHTAAVKVDPFTPPLIGHQTLANFEVYSYPHVGSYFMALTAVLLFAAIWRSKKLTVSAAASMG